MGLIVQSKPELSNRHRFDFTPHTLRHRLTLSDPPAGRDHISGLNETAPIASIFSKNCRFVPLQQEHDFDCLHEHLGPPRQIDATKIATSSGVAA